MNKKGLAILLRTKMRPLSPATDKINQMQLAPKVENKMSSQDSSSNTTREFEQVKELMHSAISMNKTEILDAMLSDFSEGYSSLSQEKRKKLLLILAREYDLNRIQVRELMKQYLDLELPSGEKAEDGNHDEEGSLSSFYRIERNLRHALKPMYEVLFEWLNTHPGGLKFLSIIRAEILSILAKKMPLKEQIEELLESHFLVIMPTISLSLHNKWWLLLTGVLTSVENIASLRALDSYLKEKLITWLSPANLELHHITWDDPASLLEKIVAYEAVHPISNLIDLKRRLGVGRRCFGYLHPAIPGEPLIFIEVALMKNAAQTIQPGLAGINLGKFLIKRVIDLVKKDMPHISTFATLSPIPGYMQWLLSKLASADRSGSAFQENMLEPEEESALIESSKFAIILCSYRGGKYRLKERVDSILFRREFAAGKDGMEVMLSLLTSTNYEWTSDRLISVLEKPLLRLCARYLLQEKKRGKALDSVANFHLQNGAMIGRLNWMADRSEKGLDQSAGIMVNYVYSGIYELVGVLIYCRLRILKKTLTHILAQGISRLPLMFSTILRKVKT